jgi:TPR repeat protein
MKARFLGSCLALALLAGAAGVSAQSIDSRSSQSIATLKAKAESGDAEAQRTLGVNHDKGLGVPQDYAKAAIWYRKAAEQGDASSQYSLGLLYYGGQGVPQDYAESYFWFNLAASGKLESIEPEKVASLRDAAASNLTKTVLLQTQERARKWFEEHSAKAVPQ